MYKMYPSDARALEVTKLAPTVFLTLGKVLDDIASESESKEDGKERNETEGHYTSVLG